MIRSYKGISPTIGNNVYIDEQSSVIGDVILGDNCSIWPQAVLRGDGGRKVIVGKNTNIQDGAILHGYGDTIIGEGVTVAHGVIVHGAIVGDNVLLGMGCIILDNAEIGDNCIVGAGSLITGGKKFPPGSMILGSPAKAVRQLTEAEIESIRENAQDYMNEMKYYIKK